MKRFILLSIMLAILSACNPYDSFIPKQYIGNWINVENGLWEYGFFEEFVIYKNDFWKYDNVEFVDNELNISISKLNQNEKLKISIENDSMLIVKNNNIEKKYSHNFVNISIDNEFDNFFNSDSLISNKYEIDSATLLIYIRNTAHGLVSLFDRNNVDDSLSFLARSSLDFNWHMINTIDSTEHFGWRYKINIPLVGLSEICNVFKHSLNLHCDVILQPKDSLMVFIDPEHLEKNDVLFMGQNQFLNRDITNYSKTLDFKFFDNFYCSKYYEIHDIDSLKQLYNQDTLNFNNYVKNSEFPISDKFKAYKFNYYKYCYNYRVFQLLPKDSIKIEEDAINYSNFVFNYYNNYILECWSSLIHNKNPNDSIYHIPSTPENLQLHKDWIVISWGIERDNQIIDPQFIKELGFSDEFIEFYRLQNALKCFEHSKVDDLKYSSIKDFEVEYVLRNIKNPSYLKFIDYYRTHVRNYHVTKNDNVLFYTYY